MAKLTGKALLCALIAGQFTGCSTTPTTPAVSRPPADVVSAPEPTPAADPPSRTGNPESYVVFGKRYRVDSTSEGYRQNGTASWYGEPFHGRKTSSGEIYDMYEVSAAHKSLPIPTYVRVTHRENGRSLVVKVNDRGPFVGDRIIDLSYAAALKLDMVGTGTASVEVTAIPPYQYIPDFNGLKAGTAIAKANPIPSTYGAGATPPPRLAQVKPTKPLPAPTSTPALAEVVEPAPRPDLSTSSFTGGTVASTYRATEPTPRLAQTNPTAPSPPPIVATTARAEPAPAPVPTFVTPPPATTTARAAPVPTFVTPPPKPEPLVATTETVEPEPVTLAQDEYVLDEPPSRPAQRAARKAARDARLAQASKAPAAPVPSPASTPRPLSRKSDQTKLAAQARAPKPDALAMSRQVKVKAETPARLGQAGVKPAVPTRAVYTTPVKAKAQASESAQPVYLQVGAFAQRNNAERLQNQLAPRLRYAIRIDSGERKLHKVKVGPLKSAAEAEKLVGYLAGMGINARPVSY